MRRNIILAIVLLVLGYIAYKIVEKNRVSRTMSDLKEERDFTIDDNQEIKKIILKRVGEEPIRFTKISNAEWKLNDKYRANEVMVGYMIQVLKKAKIHSIPSKNAHNNIHNYLKSKGITVEVFNQNEELIKKIHIGSDLQGGESTYFLKDGYAQAYAMELPGLGGGLRSRFEQKVENYRDIFIYREPSETIQSISVDYSGDPSASYIISKTAAGFDIKPLDNNTSPVNGVANENKLKTYISFFESLGAESLYNEYEGKSTVIQSIPFCTVKVERTDGETKEYRYYDYDKFVREADERSRSVDAIHIGRFFVYTGEDLYTVQSGVFGKIFSAYSYFF